MEIIKFLVVLYFPSALFDSRRCVLCSARGTVKKNKELKLNMGGEED